MKFIGGIEKFPLVTPFLLFSAGRWIFTIFTLFDSDFFSELHGFGSSSSEPVESSVTEHYRCAGGLSC